MHLFSLTCFLHWLRATESGWLRVSFALRIKNFFQCFIFVFLEEIMTLISVPVAHICHTGHQCMNFKNTGTHGWKSLRQRGWHCHCYPHSHYRRPHHQTPARKSMGRRRLPPPQISSSVFRSWPAASAPETERQQRGHTLFNIQFRAFIILYTLN